MEILAIETSCDDTCISIIKASGGKKPCFDILSNIVSSQVKIHQKYGGVYPTLAKREHQKNLVPVLKRALRKAKILKVLSIKYQVVSKNRNKKLEKILIRERGLYKQLERFFKKYQKPKIDAIAVTKGPGLEPCLWVGVNFAKALSYYWQLPIIPVNHIESHILVNFINKFQVPPSGGSACGRPASFKFQDLFPAVCLVVSGGHTQLILMRRFGDYKIIGETRDDAAGECFDKTARILGLGYPGGPAIAALASKASRGPTSTSLPRPMIHTKDYDFSFSGLKTAVLYAVKKKYGKALLHSTFSKTTEGQQYIKQMCAEIQQAIIDVLIKKTIRAAKNCKAKTIILGGGVASNNELRKQLKRACLIWKVKHLVPPKNFCTDNAAMVGITAYFHYKEETKNLKKIEAEANLRIHPVK